MKFLLIPIIVSVILAIGNMLPSQQEDVSVCCQTSVTAVQNQVDRLFYLTFSGDQDVIDNVCSAGDCKQGFHSLLEALNYWTKIYGIAYNINIVPIPTPTG